MVKAKAKRKTSAKATGEKIIESSGNVFVDLGFDESEAEVLKMRAEVMLRIEAQLKDRGWTQAEAAKRLRTSQPRISKLRRGAWEEFSLDTLLTMAARAGLKPELRIGR